MVSPSLPQNDPNPERRQVALRAKRKMYQFNHEHLPGIAMANEVPQQDSSLNNLDWTRDAISLVLRARSNKNLQEINEEGLSPLSIWRLAASLGLYRLMSDRADSGFWLKLLRSVLSLVQKVQGALGGIAGEPRSENIEADIAAGQTNPVATRVGSMVNVLKEPNQHLPKAESIARPAKMTPTPASRTVDTVAEAASVGDLLVDLSKASMTDYQALFKIYDDLFQLIHLPCISKHFHEDKAFAAQRVAGANPLVIEKIETLPTNFPVTDTQFQAVMGNQDSLATAGAEGRLYLADYKVLEGVVTGDFPEAQKYLSAPLVLFAVPAIGQRKGRSLIPIAIQCGQTPSATNPIFTPAPICTPQSEKWSWLIAKTIVQIADGNYHELISHLGRTHLLIEAFVVATERQLAPYHPVGILLRPHFEGTLFINASALTGLIEDKGTVDKVLSGTIEASKQLAAKGVKGYPYDFNASMLPKTLVARGVDDAAQLPDYPYRDDALLVWDAIHDWVTAYLALYYADDAAVLDDSELQAWASELVSAQGGKVQGFGEATDSTSPLIQTVSYLVDALTLIIFTGSAQHAAVNFPQSRLMTYGPNMPLAGYRPAPTAATGATAQDYLDLLPSLAQAEVQMNMTYPLGSLYYTRLGDYPQGHFEDVQVKQPLQAFQRQLEKVGITIDERNSKRPTFYDYLHPNNIPQSINI
ncbi:MAG: lipoxygenase family protein [Cyanobacteria bacterium P01_D01_bin.105]